MLRRWALRASVVAWVLAAPVSWPDDEVPVGRAGGGGVLAEPKAAWGQVYDVADRPPRLRQLSKEVRAAIRRFRRQVGFALARWQQWLPKLIQGSVALVIVGTGHREWIVAVRRREWAQAKERLALAVSLFLALVLDRRTPLVGKALLVASLFYLTANRDLLWDQRGLVGLVDDVAVLALGARGFVAACPDRIVESWARRIVARRAQRRSVQFRNGQTSGSFQEETASQPSGSGHADSAR